MPEDAPYAIRCHPEASEDLRRLPAGLRGRILTAIEKRLGAAPDRYGQRLRQSLHGYWKMRVGDQCVVYEIVGKGICVYGSTRRASRGSARGPQ